MTHICAYIRQSSEEGAKRDLSCPAQEQRFIADVERRVAQGETVTYEIAPWDEGKSGGEMDRPGLQWLLERLDRFQEVWVYDHDRLVRHDFYAPVIMRELRSRNIRLWVSQGGSDEKTPMGRFMTDVRMRFGAYYREEIGETTKRTRDYRLKEGLWSGHAPTGYRFVEEHGAHSRHVLVPDSETAPKVRALFRMMADGTSQKEACRLLSVPVSTFVWQRDNPLYIGLVYKHKANLDALDTRTHAALWALATDPDVTWIYPGKHEALIGDTEWDALEFRRASRSKARVSAKYGLSGSIRCAKCGRVMRVKDNHGWPTLRCDPCGWNKSYRYVEDTMLSALATTLHDPDFEQAAEAELRRAREPENFGTVDALILERSAALRQLDKALDLLIDRDDLSGDVRARAVGLRRRADELTRLIDREKARIASQPTLVRSWRVAQSKLMNTPVAESWQKSTAAEQRDLLGRVFARIEAGDDNATFYMRPPIDVVYEVVWVTHHASCEEATTGVDTGGAVDKFPLFVMLSRQ